MSIETKSLPKSLHTITAIVRVAELHLRINPEPISKGAAIACALGTLGYAGAADPHGLAAKALKALEA